jgi:FlaA1/EpsC-like NDP-sugar epimerase
MRNRFILLADLPLFAVSALAAFILRFDWFFVHFQHEFVVFLVAALLLKPIVLYAFGMYSRYWEFASVDDMMHLTLASLASAVSMAIVVTALLFMHVIEQFPRAIVPIDGLITLVVLGASRATVRLLHESRKRNATTRPGAARRVLIAGAGTAGAMVAREISRNPQLGLVPVGFLDDDAAKTGKRIQGLIVFGALDALPSAVAAHGVQEVIIAMPSVAGKIVRAVAETCRTLGVPSRTIPGMYEMLDGNASVSRLRKVEIADLLRRSETDWNTTAGDYVTGKTVLVTGGGGSIGLELCRQVARRNPGELILLGHGENSLFEAQSHLKSLFPSVPTRAVVADVRDSQRLSHLIGQLRPQVIFHAAAHKHVPLMEANPEEAITNNIFGTRNMVDAALKAGVDRFVMISTDKAVSPSSLMGASKRIAEAIVRDAAARHQRAYVVVRFGNVLGSRGSVVPEFKRQIEEGGPITITHPEMRRYFMTIPEAVHLVLSAGGLGRGGELFVLRMGAPVRIVDLARDLVRLSGADDVPIVFTGVRPGEKLEEVLWEDGADVADTAHPDILRVSEAEGMSSAELQDVCLALEHAVAAADPAGIDRTLGRAIQSFGASRADAAALRNEVHGGGRS